MKTLVESVNIRLPEGTIKRTEAHLAPRESLPAFWRKKMLEWLDALDVKDSE